MTAEFGASTMLENVQLPFFPSTTDCLAWSEDGELAIAAGEYVHILVFFTPYNPLDERVLTW